MDCNEIFLKFFENHFLSLNFQFQQAMREEKLISIKKIALKIERNEE